MKSPCHDCRLKDHAKNGPECLKCEARVEYVAWLENPDHEYQPAAAAEDLNDFSKAELISHKVRIGAKEVKPMETKTCSKCKMEKPVSDFSKSRNRPDGLDILCRECKSIKQKKYRERRKNRDSGGVPDIPQVPPAPIQNFVSQEARLVVPVDFSDYPDLYERLKDYAKGDFRLPEQQILYILEKEIPL
ncbi:MAG: hypothetical protein SWH61_03350 [Thermodesulfobacteriota bacterium]|nr:hypothetical protein [Thermodesulfobacteriota bacterium]